jgi:antitoxin component HigA of HigAB toxin-antitoxin module
VEAEPFIMRIRRLNPAWRRYNTARRAQRFSHGTCPPAAAIQHCMEVMRLRRKDREPLLGSKSHVSEIINRKRRLALEMVRKLRENLQLPAEALIREYPLRA